LTYDVLWKLNQVRQALLDALTPWPENQEDDYGRGGKGGKKGGGKGGKGGRGPGGGYIWLGDISQQMADLLSEVWPTPEPVQKPKRLVWQPAGGEFISEAHEWLQPLVEDVDWDAVQSPSASQSQGKQSRSAGGVKLSDKDSQVLKSVTDYLRSQKSNQDSLSSICGRFRCSPKVLKKFENVLEVIPNRSNKNDFTVKLMGGSNGYSGWEGSGKKGGGGKGSKGGGKSSTGKGATSTSGADRRIDDLCRLQGVGCRIGDFDLRVRRQIQGFERRRGKASADSAFEMLAEWCCKKDRDSVRSWTAYLMVLLKNWEQNTYGEDEEKPYQ